jgi:sigma-B regulation protein RsbU (phosphoserine phosphatase)
LLARPEGSALQELATTAGLPLGIEEGETFTTTALDLGSDPFMLFCYTDGVVEAMNGADEAFGLSRLRQAIIEHRELDPQTLVHHVRASVASFAAGAEQSDDITMLAVRVG